jgi:hypothetical protein
VLKCDVRQFFPSIDHQLLKTRLARKIKDVQVLALTSLILDHSNPQAAVLGDFPGDDLFTAQERRRGLPIGNQTSQFFGNVYLDALDHYVKETLGCRCYLRYVDDFVVLDNNKERLAEVRNKIEQFLQSVRLWLHPKKRAISRTTDGIRLLGFRVWPVRIWLTNTYLRKIRRRMRLRQAAFRDRRIQFTELRQHVRAWLGHIGTASSKRFRSNLLRDIVFSRTATE